MLDTPLRFILSPILSKVGEFIALSEVPANALTVIGFSFGLMAFGALTLHLYPLALILLIINRIFDGLDGPTARASGQGASDLGAYLDIVTDFIFYAGFIFFFALGKPQFALMSCLLIFSFMGTASTFLTHAIIAEKRGLKDGKNDRSFFFMSGLAEGTETFICLALICLIPEHFNYIAGVFSAMCWITVIGRVRNAFVDFRDDPIKTINEMQKETSLED